MQLQKTNKFEERNWIEKKEKKIEKRNHRIKKTLRNEDTGWVNIRKKNGR